MSEFAEGMGSAIEGGLVARSVEPARGGQAGHTHETECLNCGAQLTGAYCAACGQHGHLHRTIGALFHDILHGVLHFEGKTWSTLPMLAWKPGELTRRYIDGQRARFVSPMAVFLFSVFVMFAVFQIMGISPPIDTGQNHAKAQLHEVEEGMLAERKALEKELSDPDLHPEARAEIEKQMRQNELELSTVRSLPGFAKESEASEGLDAMHSGWKRLDKGVEKWRKNPGLMLYKLQTTAYKFSWLLIPLSIPFVAVLFLWRRRFGLYDHAVFVTYSLAFMTLMGIILTIAGGFGVTSDVLISIFVIVAVVHIYRHIKGAYELRHFSTLWRTIALLCLIQLNIALFAIILVVLGLIG